MDNVKINLKFQMKLCFSVYIMSLNCFLHVPSNWNEAVLLKFFAMEAVLYLSSPLQQAIRFACQVKDNFRVISFLYKIQKKNGKLG